MFTAVVRTSSDPAGKGKKVRRKDTVAGGQAATHEELMEIAKDQQAKYEKEMAEREQGGRQEGRGGVGAQQGGGQDQALKRRCGQSRRRQAHGRRRLVELQAVP
ncbi:unnamed protein product [Boreogadus saida]